MPFGFSVYPKTIEEYIHDIGATLDDTETVVFLDTSILSYLYKLQGAARKEFYSWAEGLIEKGRLKIPAWVLCEYTTKLKERRLGDYTVRSKEPDEIRRKLENLHMLAGSFVDESILKSIGSTDDRLSFLKKFQRAISNLSSFTNVFKTQFDADQIHQEIASKLSPAVLKSKISDLCVRAGREGELRIAHRIPPGYKDAGKSDNKYGDIIIWFEILSFSSTHMERFRKTVFLTNDDKSDWVYAPVSRIEHKAARPIPNRDPTIKLPDPRLVAEYSALVGHNNLYIITLPVFIEALSNIRPTDVKNLASAIQIEQERSVAKGEPRENGEVQEAIEENKTPHSMSLDVTGLEVGPDERPTTYERPESSAATTQLIDYPPDALRDSAYECGHSEIDEIISNLKSYNWYTQNPAITKIKLLRNKEFSASAWFVLGRNIYQAACGNSQKALEFLQNLDIELDRHAPDVANHILSGMLFEVYFGSDGRFRHRSKASQIDRPFAEVAKPRYEKTKNFILSKLAGYVKKMLVTPGNTKPVHLTIRVRKEKAPESAESSFYLQSVTLENKQLLKDLPEDSSDIPVTNMWGQRSYWNVEMVKTTLSENWVIPEWQINVTVKPQDCTDCMLTLPKGKVLDLEKDFDV